MKREDKENSSTYNQQQKEKSYFEKRLGNGEKYKNYRAQGDSKINITITIFGTNPMIFGNYLKLPIAIYYFLKVILEPT